MTRAKPRRWSWKIGQLFGISIRVHVTFFALLLLILLGSPGRGQGLLQIVGQWLLVVAVFAIVVLHEIGHALVARRFGCQTREILLLPIGGVARMDRMPERPAHEFLVAIAGPMVNVALAVVFALALGALGLPFGTGQASNAGAVLAQLMWINVGLALFNLLPAFPMDGGRVLRALLAMRFGRDRATRIAGAVGKALGVAFAILGLMYNPTLALIGVFVWFAAGQESALVELKSALSSATVADAMIRTSSTVEADEPLEVTADRMLAGGTQQLAVTDRGRLAGVITASDVALRLALPGPHGSVGSVMHRDVPVFDPTMPLESALEPLAGVGAGVALVVDHDDLVGLVTAEQLSAYAAFHPARG